MADERRTTLSVYSSDLERFQTMQRKVSAVRGEWITMSDLVRMLLDQAENTGEGA